MDKSALFKPLDKPDILDVVSSSVTLRKAGKNYVGLCPLHSEKTHSFFVNPSRQRFKCFGCGEGGDVITFVQKLHGTDFKGALRILGIDSGRSYKPDPVQGLKRELERRFREWEKKYFNQIAAEYRLLNKALDALTDMDAMMPLLKRRTIVEYHMEILNCRNDAEKLELYREVRQHA